MRKSCIMKKKLSLKRLIDNLISVVNYVQNCTVINEFLKWKKNNLRICIIYFKLTQKWKKNPLFLAKINLEGILAVFEIFSLIGKQYNYLTNTTQNNDDELCFLKHETLILISMVIFWKLQLFFEHKSFRIF